MGDVTSCLGLLQHTNGEGVAKAVSENGLLALVSEAAVKRLCEHMDWLAAAAVAHATAG